MKTLLPYLSILVVMVALDLIWLGGVAMPLYKRGIGHLMADKPDFAAGALFYLLYAAGVFVFAVRGADGWLAAAGYGALLGGLAYMTYDLTNMATLKDWPVGLSVIDVAWGCLATGLAATAGRLAADRVSGT